MNEQAQQEMPRYICHKQVWAIKIKAIEKDPNREGFYIVPEDKGYGFIYIDEDYAYKHKPELGGYYVVYQDGYKSYSPAKAFEDGYTKETNHIGHDYKIKNQNDPNVTQYLSFIYKEKNEETGDLQLVADGITNEQVIEILIDRMVYLDNKLPSGCNKSCIDDLKHALYSLKKRTNERQERGVENTPRI